MSRKLMMVALLLLFGVVLVQPASAQSATWIAQYYGNGTLNGDPVVTRNESAISFNWGGGSPASGVPNDGFSARFATDVVFPAGTYRFYLLADDGARVTVNFQPIPLINTLGQGRVGQTVTADIQLNGATHVQIDYVEVSSDAYLYLSWANVASNPSGPNFGQPVNVPVNTSAWTVQYYNNPNLAGDPSAILTESAPGRDWGNGSPLGSVPADNWSARWSSTQNLNAGQYTISARADDGVRVYVNGGLVINQWGSSTGQTYTVTVNLPQGNNNFVIEYLELGGNAFLDYRLTQFNPTVATPIPGGGGSQITGAFLTVTGAFRLNVRNAPDPTSGAVITRINRNESYPIVGRNLDTTWYQINVNGTVGWVSARFVTAQNAGSVPVVTGDANQGGGGTVTTGITVTASPYTVNVRQGPGTQFSRLARLPAGASAAVVGRIASNQWYQINYNGIVGWVTAEYVVLSPGANINSVPVTG